MAKHKFQKGDPKINRAGRPKGSLNKCTLFKNMILDAVLAKKIDVKNMKVKDLADIAKTFVPREVKNEIITKEPMTIQLIHNYKGDKPEISSESSTD